jgi:hypothetical protein
LDERCVVELCDPDAMELSEALALARQVAAAEPALGQQLGAYLEYLCGYPYPDPRLLERALDVMRGVADAKSFARLCERLGRSDNPVAAGLIRLILVGCHLRAKRATVPLDIVKVA